MHFLLFKKILNILFYFEKKELLAAFLRISIFQRRGKGQSPPPLASAKNASFFYVLPIYFPKESKIIVDTLPYLSQEGWIDIVLIPNGRGKAELNTLQYTGFIPISSFSLS